jgi:O-antigen/teichoic acid export membrane protein
MSTHQSSLKKRAVSGTIWSLVGYGGAQVLRLGGNLILTRILAPELFGLMALLMTFVQGLSLFSDIGIRPSIIQSKRGDDPVFLNTAWTMQILRGVGIFIIGVIISSPVAQFYGDQANLTPQEQADLTQQLTILLPTMTSITLMQGLNSTALATLTKKIDISKITVFELGSQVINLTLIIVFAHFSPTIWAMMSGVLISQFISTIWSHFLVPDGISHRLFWDKECARSLINFGRWIFVSTAMSFLASQADRLILGKLFSLEMLGIYTVAFTFADIPRQVVKTVSMRVIYPIISEKKELPRHQLRAKILEKRWFLLVALSLPILILTCFGDYLILFLYDPRYDQAAWMLPVLAIGFWPLLLQMTASPSLMAIGQPLVVAAASSTKFIYMLVALPFAFLKMGVLGAMIAISLNDLPGYIVISIGLIKHRLSTFLQDFRATLFVLSLLTSILALRYVLGFGTPIDRVLLGMGNW